MKVKKLVSRRVFVFKKKSCKKEGDHLPTNTDPTTTTATLTATSGVIL